MDRPLISPRRLALVLFALLSHTASAAEIRMRDGVHRQPKVEALITASPQLARRDTTVCPSSYSLCPADLSGGCCGEGYSCAVSSCYATTQGPVTCNGQEGYHACGQEFGGGCCPVGSVCERGSRCLPAPGVSYSHECGASSYLCPESLGYGCCKEGLACGSDRCYSTDASTLVLTRTITTTEDDEEITTTETVTTVSTPGEESTETEAPEDEALQKFYPTAVPKVDPIITEDSDGGGLTSGQIGGAVAGSIIFLIIVIVAAFFIIRRLNHVAKVVEESKSPDPDEKPDAAGHYATKPGDGDSSSLGTRTATGSPRSRFRSGTTDSDSEVPTLFGSPSPHTPGSEVGSRRESNRSTSSDGLMTVSSLRNESIRTSRGRSPEGFAMPVSPEPAELEAATVRAELAGDVSPIPELPSPVPGSARLSRGKEGSHKRSLSAATPALDVVVEDGEYHGYYGPLDKVAGQTTAAGPSGTSGEGTSGEGTSGEGTPRENS